MVGIDYLVGKTLTKVTLLDEEIRFYFSDTDYLLMYHIQDCCESVYIDDINGDMRDLVGTPILVAEERVSDGSDPEEYGTATWTFYTIRTIKGSVDIRWYGSSNGCYSESVDFELVTD